MAAEARAVRVGTKLASLLTIAAFACADWLIPTFTDFPDALAERLTFAAMCWAVTGFVLLVAIMIVSTARRLSSEEIGERPVSGIFRAFTNAATGVRAGVVHAWDFAMAC